MLLEVNDLRVRYGRMVALQSVTLAVPAGTLVAMLGANGAGRTTTLRTISGLLRASGGSIRFAGTDLGRLPAHRIARAGIAHVPEGRGSLPTISVAENLKIGALCNPDRSGISALYDSVLEHFPVLRQRLGQSAGLLSGGEQQMLSLARALLQGPKLLMVDEMSLGLAPKVVEALMHVLVDLTRRGVAVLCVEQNTRLVLQHAAHGYVLETGRTIMEGTGAALLHDSRVAQAYLGCRRARSALAAG